MTLSNTQNTPIYGGQTVYGASIGILMLDSQFPRILGDIGHAETWPFPVHYKIVKGASPQNIVHQTPKALLPSFIQAAEELIGMGVKGISTSCGFLGLYQAELSAALSVPVASSSLMQVALVKSTLPAHQQVGILTIAQQSLSQRHLAAVNVPDDTPIMGMDRANTSQSFVQSILNNDVYLDVDKARHEIKQAALQFKAEHPDLAALVLECTNMTPYAALLQRELNIPVYSIYSLICWFQSGLKPKAFPFSL